MPEQFRVAKDFCLNSVSKLLIKSCLPIIIICTSCHICVIYRLKYLPLCVVFIFERCMHTYITTHTRMSIFIIIAKKREYLNTSPRWKLLWDDRFLSKRTVCHASQDLVFHVFPSKRLNVPQFSPDISFQWAPARIYRSHNIHFAMRIDRLPCNVGDLKTSENQHRRSIRCRLRIAQKSADFYSRLINGQVRITAITGLHGTIIIIRKRTRKINHSCNFSANVFN